MAASRSLVTAQSLKSDIAAGTHLLSPVIKANSSRHNILNYNSSGHLNSVRLSSAVSRVLSPINNNPLSRSIFNGIATNNKPVTNSVLCSLDPAGLTDSSVGIFKKFKVDLKKWCDKQCLPVGAAAYTLVEAFQSAVFGFIWKLLADTFVIDMPISELELIKPSLGIYYPLALTVAGSPFIVARTFAVITTCIEATTYVIKRLRGKEEDIMIFMVAGFVTPVMHSLVAGMRSPVVILIGVICSLMCGLIFKAINQLQGRGKPQMIKADTSSNAVKKKKKKKGTSSNKQA